MRKQYGVPQYTELPLNPAILGIYSKTIEISGSDIYIPIFRELYIYINQQEETTQVFINKWMDKQNVV